MIIRVFRAQIHPGKGEFERFVRETGHRFHTTHQQGRHGYIRWGCRRPI